jgi:hypothetical protein
VSGETFMRFRKSKDPNNCLCRFRWPGGLRRRSAAVRLLRLWVRIPPGAWISFVSVVCCKVEVSATSWSLVQRSPIDCGPSSCVIQKPREWGSHGPLGTVAPKHRIIVYANETLISVSTEEGSECVYCFPFSWSGPFKDLAIIFTPGYVKSPLCTSPSRAIFAHSITTSQCESPRTLANGDSRFPRIIKNCPYDYILP